jgi:hypothetical protein
MPSSTTEKIGLERSGHRFELIEVHNYLKYWPSTNLATQAK